MQIFDGFVVETTDWVTFFSIILGRGTKTFMSSVVTTRKQILGLMKGTCFQIREEVKERET